MEKKLDQIIIKVIKNSHYFILILIILSCNRIDNDYVSKNIWQLEQGGNIGSGDFLEFGKGENYSIKNDTIFNKKMPIALIIELNKKLEIITIFSFKSKKTSIYMNISELTNGGSNHIDETVKPEVIKIN